MFHSFRWGSVVFLLAVTACGGGGGSTADGGMLADAASTDAHDAVDAAGAGGQGDSTDPHPDARVPTDASPAGDVGSVADASTGSDAGAVTFVPPPSTLDDMLRACALLEGCLPTDSVTPGYGNIDDCAFYFTSYMMGLGQVTMWGELDYGALLGCSRPATGCGDFLACIDAANLYAPCPQVGEVCDGQRSIHCGGPGQYGQVNDCAALGVQCVSGACRVPGACPVGGASACGGPTDSLLFCQPGDIDARQVSCGGLPCSSNHGVYNCQLPTTPCAEPGGPLWGCRGDVQTVCARNQELAFDCGVLGLTCTVNDGCVAARPNCGGSSTCEGTTVVSCFKGTEVRFDCASVGMACRDAPNAAGASAPRCMPSN